MEYISKNTNAREVKEKFQKENCNQYVRQWLEKLWSKLKSSKSKFWSKVAHQKIHTKMKN